jgi:hypothetical protein
MSRPVVAMSAVSAGCGWLVWEGLRRTWDGSTGADCSSAAEYTGDAVFAGAALLVALTMLGLGGRLSGVGRWCALASAAGAAMMGLGNAVEHCAAEPFFIVYVAGAMLMFLATAALGVVALVIRQGRTLGRWRGVLLIVAAFALWLSFDRGGAALLGLAWIAFGVSLMVGGEEGERGLAR